jgi:hypothetical protein
MAVREGGIDAARRGGPQAMQRVCANGPARSRITNFWEQAGAVGIDLNAGELSVGDRIGYALPLDFEEEAVESIQLNDAQVEKGRLARRSA